MGTELAPNIVVKNYLPVDTGAPGTGLFEAAVRPRQRSLGFPRYIPLTRTTLPVTPSSTSGVPRSRMPLLA